MSRTQVAVVIVTYRSAELTIGCLHSIARERGGDIDVQCFVVDNASGDSPAIRQAIEAQGWGSWATLITAERNGGFAYGNNLGIRQALQQGRPQYFHLLNPDTVLKPGAIAALVHFLEQNPQAGIVGGAFENGDGSDWRIAFRFPTITSEAIGNLGLGPLNRLLGRHRVAIDMGDVPQQVDWVSGASMMVSARVLAAIGGMDEDFFLYFEETEFCFRARNAGFGVWYVPASLVIHIAGQSTKVTERNAGPRRLPAYWFHSRRRYFARTRGVSYSIAADAAALLGGMIELPLRAMRGHSGATPPHYLRDLLAHSLLWSHERRASQQKSSIPGISA